MNEDEKQKLFAEFKPISTEDWEACIHADLKGADYSKKLVWKTPDGLSLKPYYRGEHLEHLDTLGFLPGEYPYIRGNKKVNNDWDIRQDITVTDIAFANKKALFMLNRGVSSLGFIVENLEVEKVFSSQSDFPALLKDIAIECIKLNFVSGVHSEKILQFLISEAKQRNLDPTQLKGTLDFDPLGNITIRGNFYDAENADLNKAVSLINTSNSETPSMRAIGVNAKHFNNAGASVVQELAMALSMGTEYLAILTDKGLKVEEILPQLQFNFGAGSGYFMEIAKIRAARMLWAKVVERFGCADKQMAKMVIHTETSAWNKSIYDPHVNMLRTTTEAMSAILGGTDSLMVRNFNFPYSETSEFSERIARNTQIILKEEAYFDKIADPAAGSYYIENVTNAVAGHAWVLFQEIETAGGYLAALKSGLIQGKIKETVETRKNDIATRRELLLGTNEFANANESMFCNIDFNFVEKSKIKVESPIVEPIELHRGTEAFEKLRLRTEETKRQRPKVFMLTIGNLTMRKARASFSSNFFASAGYEIIDNNGFASVEEGVKTAMEQKADIVVLCSSDDEYTEYAKQAYSLLANKAILVIAGYPKAILDDLREMGICNFIHIKSNVLGELQNFQDLLNV